MSVLWRRPPGKRLVLAVTLGVSLAIGCAPTGHDPVWTTPDWGEPADGADVVAAHDSGAPLDVWDTAAAGEFTGWYDLRAQINVKAAGLPFETTQRLLLRVVQQGDTLRQHITLCGLQLPGLEGIAQLSVPGSLSALLLAEAKEETGPFLAKDRWSPPTLRVVLGAELSAEDDPLPTQAGPVCEEVPEPPCTTDPDGDGEPGVPIVADIVVCDDNPQTLHIALRMVVTLDGTVAPGGATVVGPLTAILEFAVTGMSDPCLEVAEALILEPGADSSFQAERLSADPNQTLSCADLP